MLWISSKYPLCGCTRYEARPSDEAVREKHKMIVVKIEKIPNIFLMYLCKSLYLLSLILDDIIPEWEWSSDEVISIRPRTLRYFIKWTVKYHRLARLWVYSNTEHFIGMIGSSCRFIVTSVGNIGRVYFAFCKPLKQREESEESERQKVIRSFLATEERRE